MARAVYALMVIVSALVWIASFGCATAIKVVTAPIVPIVGFADWVHQRADCGFKCSHDSSCEVYASGVFVSSYACACKYPSKDEGGNTFLYPSDGRPCQPKPEAK